MAHHGVTPRISDSAFIAAAGAVVPEGFEVPEGALVAGVPARIIHRITDEERSALKQSAQNYISYARSFAHHPAQGSP